MEKGFGPFDRRIGKKCPNGACFFISFFGKYGLSESKYFNRMWRNSIYRLCESFALSF